MLTQIKLNDTEAPCKLITLPCTYFKNKRIAFIESFETSILSCCATTKSKIK